MEARLAQPSTLERAEEAPEESAWKLPPDVLPLVLARVPLEARLRAAGVSRDWRAAAAAATTAISLRRAHTAWTDSRLEQLSRWLAAGSGTLESLELHALAAGFLDYYCGGPAPQRLRLPLQLPRLRSLVLHGLELELLDGPAAAAAAGEAGRAASSASTALPALTRLELHGTSSSSLGSPVQLVQQCSVQLRHLQLNWPRAGCRPPPLPSAAGVALPAALPSCTQLTQLVLEWLAPSSLAAVAGALRGLPQLRALTLELPGSQGAGALLEALPLGLTRLAFGAPALACDAGACRLLQLTALQDLELRYFDRLHASHLEPLTGLSRLALTAYRRRAVDDPARLLRLVGGLALRELDLVWCLPADDAPPASWSALTASSQLTRLHAFGDVSALALQHAFAAGRPALVSLASLSLRLQDAEGVVEAARALRWLPRLERLSLTGAPQTSEQREAMCCEHVPALLQSLTEQPGGQLTSLALYGLANGDALRHVAGMTWLRELDLLGGGGYTASCALQLSRLRGLRSLKLGGLEEQLGGDFEWHSTAADDEPSNLWQLHGEAFRTEMEELQEGLQAKLAEQR